MDLRKTTGSIEITEKRRGWRRFFGLSPKKKNDMNKSPTPAKPKITVKTLEDFPPDVRSELRSAGIDREKLESNINVLVNIFSFLLSHAYVFVYSNEEVICENNETLTTKSLNTQQRRYSGEFTVNVQASSSTPLTPTIETSSPPQQLSIPKDNSKENKSPFLISPRTREKRTNTYSRAKSPPMDILGEINENSNRLFKTLDLSSLNVHEREIDEKAEEIIIPLDPQSIFKKTREVAKGGFGVVFEGFGKDKEKVAIKVVPSSTDKEKRMNLREIGSLISFQHPNIVKLLCSYFYKDEIWVIMEFMEGGTLTEATNLYSFDESQISYVAREILKGLEFLHSKEFMHSDLKSGNIMMSTQGEIKLIDFGLCCHKSMGLNKKMAGSPYWMPPEMILRVPYSLNIDIWSFGICLLELANRKPPTRTNRVKAMFITATAGCQNALMDPEKWTPLFSDFLSQSLAFDHTQRPSASQLLKHEFIQKAAGVETMKQILSGAFIQNNTSSSS